MCDFRVLLVLVASITLVHVSSAKRTDADVAAKLIANETYDSTDDKKLAKDTFCWGVGLSHVRCNKQNYVSRKLRGTLHSCVRADQWGRIPMHPGFTHGALKIAGLATSTDDPFVCVERCVVKYSKSKEKASKKSKGGIPNAVVADILNGMGEVDNDYNKIPNTLVYRTGNAAETRCVAETEIRKVTDPIETVLKASPMKRIVAGMEKLEEEKKKNARERKLMSRGRKKSWAAEYQKLREEGEEAARVMDGMGLFGDDMKFVLLMMGIKI